MKYALVIPDGVADEPQDSLKGRTPLEAARIPHMDRLVRRGRIGRTVNVPPELPSGSDVGTMNLFGYDPRVCHTGRAPLEAAARGIQLNDADWALRCNMVTLDADRMVSFTADQIPDRIARQLIEILQHDLPADSPWTFHAGVSYRNLLVFDGSRQPAPFTAETLTIPPHDLTDQPVQWPRGPGADELRRLMDRSRQLFAADEVNRKRVDQGVAPASGVWLWGQGRRPGLDSFEERFGVRAAVITAVDLLRGIGKLIGWQVINVPGATGYTDTNYRAKGQAAITALSAVDMIVVHVEATDEASHEGDAAAKVEAVEAIDREIVGPLHSYLQSQGEFRLLVCPDHPTFLRTKTHSHGDCPFAVCGTGVEPDEFKAYSEPVAAQSSDYLREGHLLMPRFLSADGF